MEDGADELATADYVRNGSGGSVKESKHTLPESRNAHKKVTFDPDLQVRTIPKRIPSYERRPAENTFHVRSQQHPMPFTPRPLDSKGKDRYLLGASTSKKIIDMFNLQNGFPSYPVSLKTDSKNFGRSQGEKVQAIGHLNLDFALSSLKTTRINRCTLNMKQATAPLGQCFDLRIHKEHQQNSKANPSRVSTRNSATLKRVDRSVKSQANESSGKLFIRKQSSNTLKIKARHKQQQEQVTLAQQPNLSPSSSRGSNPKQQEQADEILPSSSKLLNCQRLPSITTEQIAFTSRTRGVRGKSAGVDTVSYSLGPMEDETSKRRASVERSSGPLDDYTPSGDQPPSRCSSIDTHANSDRTAVKTSSEHRVLSTTHRLRHKEQQSAKIRSSSRFIAWEAGVVIPVNEPVLGFSALRTSPAMTGNSEGLRQLQVISRPYLSI